MAEPTRFLSPEHPHPYPWYVSYRIEIDVSDPDRTLWRHAYKRGDGQEVIGRWGPHKSVTAGWLVAEGWVES